MSKELTLPKGLLEKIDRLEADKERRVQEFTDQVNHQIALLVTGYIASLDGDEGQYRFDLSRRVILDLKVQENGMVVTDDQV